MADTDPMGRRAFLTRSAALGAITAIPAGFVVACSSESSGGSEGGSDSGASTGSSALDQLASDIDGTLLVPDDTAFAVAAAPHNVAVDAGPPEAVLLAAGADDVARGLAFAQDQGMAFTAMSGAHSYAGYSTTSGLIISVSQLSDVTVDADTDTATVGTGATLSVVYEQLAAAGYAVPGGSCPTVGVAGITLGGGFGFLSRRYGMLCDNLRSVTVVTADGTVRTASADSDPDLFWALQGGGGGNFGIVTSFEFDVHPIDDVAAATLVWPWSEAAKVFDAWQRLATAAPDELTSNCSLSNSGTGDDPDNMSVTVNAIYLGGTDELRDLLDPLYVAAGEPESDSSLLEAMTWMDAVYHLAGCTGIQQCQRLPIGGQTQQHAYYQSGYAADLYDSDAIDLLVSTIEAWPGTSDGGVLEFDAYGGAINRVAPDATAFVHRDQLFLGQYQAYWEASDSSSQVDAAKEWLRTFGAAIAEHNSGFAYQNYIDPELDGWEQAYYGDNFDRLVSVKDTYDPDDVFTFAQSIPTSTN